jgi:GNAT superfamily N-acetyltransferase
MSGEELIIFEANLDDSDHQKWTLDMLDAYASDPMGDGKPLSAEARMGLIRGLRNHPTTLVFLVMARDRPVGVAVCFKGFSTFAARPLVSISDYFIVPAFRAKGIGRRLLTVIESRAIEFGCCKLTLEVQENNHRARRVYSSAGFKQAVYTPEAGGSLFLVKPL